ncbi:MAG: glycosyltransferase [Opitutales bacterium]
MQKVLIVSPHFPPVNAADLHRVRLALPYLRDHGWEPTVLAVAPDSVEGAVIDEVLLRTYPADIRVIRVKGLSVRYTRWAGIGSLWWRCGWALRTAGEKLLGAEQFDLVFFSTTQFDAFTLGPRWRRKFGVPYVLDYQDPWINDYYRDNHARPPGGALKYWFAQRNARRHEPAVLRSASAIIAVSSSYGPMLQQHYPWFSAAKVVTLPFGTSSLDLEIARDHRVKSSLVPFGDGHVHHVYAGRCGPDMTTAMTALLRGFRLFLKSHPDEAARHRFHFIGTDYAPPPLGREWAVPVAVQENVRPYVFEHRYRVPYFDALHYLTQADALVVVGSNDPTYSPSKIFPYLLARRPLVAIVHERSLLVAVARADHVATCFTFNQTTEIDNLARHVHDEWFVAGRYRDPHQASGNLLREHGAAAMTARLVAEFDAARADGKVRPPDVSNEVQHE